MEPLEQLLHGDVDVDHLVRGPHESVGHRVVDLAPRDATHEVVEALEVLNSEGSDHVNPRIEDLEHVLEPPGVASVGRVAVSDVIYHRDSGLAREDGLEVHVLHRHPAELDPPPRHGLESVDEPHGLGPSPWIDEAEHDVHPTQLEGLRLLEHPGGLPDARRRADVELQPSATTALDELQEVGRAPHGCRW